MRLRRVTAWRDGVELDRGRLRLRVLLFALVVALGPSAVRAQAVPPPLPAVPAQQQPLPTPEQLRNPASPPPAAPRTRVRIRDQVESAPCLLDRPENAALRIRIVKARFANLGPVSQDEIADAYRPYLDTDQPISAICRVRDAVATRLRALGYIASVEVPVQRIVGGDVAFNVLYARVTQVRVLGEPGHSAKLFAAMLQRLVDGREFNRFRAERIVLLARDVPGYDVQLTLKPAGTGAGDLVAEVRLVRTPVVVSAILSNLAAPATGRFGAQLRGDFSGLLGIGDQTTVSAYSTLNVHEQQIYQVGEQALVGPSGLRASGRVTYALTRPSLGLAASVDAHTLYVNAELSYPIRRSVGLTLRGVAGLDLLDQDVTFGGLPLSRDRLRIGYVRLDLDAIDLAGIGPDNTIGWHVTGSLEARHGFDILGGQSDCTRRLSACTTNGAVPPTVLIGDPQATVIRGSAQAEVHVLRDVLFSIAPRGQISSGPVAAFEQYTLGNQTVGRGYTPGILAGDDGAGFALEARSRQLAPLRHAPLQLQVYAFTDAGWTWRRRAASANPEHLVSAGGGVRLDYPGLAALDLAAAVPLQTLPGATRRGHPLVLLTLLTNILPWRTR